MNALSNFLENLRPGGASNIPKSKLEQELTQDSDLDSPEPKPTEDQKKALEGSGNPVVRPKKKMVKQVADVYAESSEFEDIKMPEIPLIEKAKTTVPPVKPNPRKSIIKPNEQNNDEIKDIWKDVGIGEEGYLTLPELEKLCNSLGMNDMDKEDIHKLFVDIDTDKDNKVSLDEFSNGLKNQNQLKKVSDEMAIRKTIRNRLTNNSMRSSTHLFSTLDPNKSGFSKRERIIEFWSSGGILNGLEVLEFLNFKSKENIDLVELSVSLEKEMLMADLDAISLSGIITYQMELKYCRSIIELMEESNLSGKNKNDEKKQILELQAQIISLQEMNKVALNTQRSEFESTINEVTLNNKELMERIIKLNREMSTTDYEYSQLKKKLLEVQELNLLQEDELDAVAELHRKMELELNLLRDAKLIFNQTMTKNDRDELYALKKKFEQQFERASNHSLDRMSEVNGNQRNVGLIDRKPTITTRTVQDLEKKLQLKIDEVRYLRKELDDSIFNRNNNNEKENSQTKFKDMEFYLATEKKKCQEYKEENEKLRVKLQSMEDKVEIAINREKVYRNKIECLEKDGQNSIETVLTETKNKLDENTKTHQMKLDKYSKRAEELEFENKELNKICNSREKDLERAKEEINQCHKDIFKKNNEIKDQKKLIVDLNDALEASKEDVRLNKILVEKLEMATDRLSKSLKNAAEKINEYSHQNFDYSSKDIINENIKIQKENMLLEAELSQLNRQLANTEFTNSKEFAIENKNLQRKIKENENKIEELEEKLHKKDTNLRYDQFGSAKKLDQLQFKYAELDKKYQLQLEQVDKTDSLLADLYKENSKLMKSLQRSEVNKEENEIKIIQLEEKIKTLQNILNRTS